MPPNNNYQPIDAECYPPTPNASNFGELIELGLGGFNGEHTSVSVYTKVEQPFPTSIITSVSQLDTLKNYANDDMPLSEVKVAPDRNLDENTSQALMRFILGEDQTLTGFDIRLNNDAFLAANSASAKNVFPVIPTNQRKLT